MAVCGSLQHIFESPLPESPTTLLESFSSSWNQIKPLRSLSSMQHHDNSSSFTEMFGELHFKENPSLMPSSSSSPSLVDFDIPQEAPQPKIIDNKDKNMNHQKSPSNDSSASTNHNKSHKSSDSFSSMNSESLQLCTEGLGFESSDEVEDIVKNDISDQDTNNNDYQEEKVCFRKQYFPISENINCCSGDFIRRSRTSVGGFPPPISCISKSGKPWVCFKSYRHDGRFVLKEIRIPTQEFLHAYREDGRLKLHFVMPGDEILGEEDDVLDYEEEEEDDDDDDEKIGEDYLHADAADEINEGDIEAKGNK